MLYDPKWKVKTAPVDAAGTLLLRAADLIDERGHSKGQLVATNGSVCALGALMVADKEFGTNEYDAASARLRSHLGVRFIAAWNNKPERTAAEVTQAMRACSTART